MTSRQAIGAVAPLHARESQGESDATLMGRVQAGDTAAFAELYSRYAVRALRVASAVCHDIALAEEAVQEGFLAIWRSRARYRPECGSFRAWAMRMVQNRAIDAMRDRSARARREQLDALSTARLSATSASPQEEAIAHWERQALRASLDRIPPTQAEVIALAYFGGLTQAEIAAQLGLPEGTVKGRMRLGLQKMRRQMAHTGLAAGHASRAEAQAVVRSSGLSRGTGLEKRIASSSIGPKRNALRSSA
jgi:RNA polymerase sigma factor (sigma-70 family)